MKCPKCNSELTPYNVSTIFGVQGDNVDVLAQGDMQVAFCCGVAVLYERPEEPKEESRIITPPQEIILPS